MSSPSSPLSPSAPPPSSRRSAARRRARVRTGAAVVVAGLAGALLPASAAYAQERAVSGGRLDWGIKSSFQSYVTGPIAKGSWNLQGGAATVGGSQFRFHSAKGSYDPDTGAFTAAFSGGVHFTGHKKGGAYALDLTISRPTVEVAGGSGTLFADMVSKDKGTGKVTSTAQVPLAKLNVSGINMKGGTGPIALTTLPTTLTAQGAKAFAGYYTAGTQLDPVSLSTDLVTGSAGGKKDKAEDGPKGRAGGKDAAEDKSAAKEKTAGRIEDAAVDWGVRRTFREYVSGSIAKGKWTLTSGAQDGGALFRFPKGAGTYDEKKHTLSADFAGAVRFTGGHGLDIGLSHVAVAVRDGEGTLYADVAGKGFTKKKAPLVTFTDKELTGLTPKDGLIAVTEAPAKLTADGSKAFGSLYPPGTAMDPVSLAVAVDGDAELPALPDLGSAAAPGAKESPAGAKSGSTAGSDGSADSDSDSGSDSSKALPIVLGSAAALLVAAAVAFLLVRKRRQRRPEPATENATEASTEASGAAKNP
ncbi:HtaA domain-containing protein [Streptomyces silvensis]|uniref:Htaa domain protein n=1 Tax=Streptomyces silvensis TaxID=1765722 RepID=A0A0W7WXI5_9ACTN|nr:HtaA domain-containing protein [Streptomyces silvensis]KUF15280.1 Htaa domain protein [Streptomyces silvensis]